MNIKVKLLTGQFMFSENFSLYGGVEQDLDSDKLSYTDLFLIANKVQNEQMQSSVGYDKLIELADKIKPQVSEPVQFASQEETAIEVVEVEVKTAEEKQAESEFLKEIQEQIENAPTSIAVKNVAALKEDGRSKEFFEEALQYEKATKKRGSVLKALDAAIEK